MFVCIIKKNKKIKIIYILNKKQESECSKSTCVIYWIGKFDSFMWISSNCSN